MFIYASSFFLEVIFVFSTPQNVKTLRFIHLILLSEWNIHKDDIHFKYLTNQWNFTKFYAIILRYTVLHFTFKQFPQGVL